MFRTIFQNTFKIVRYVEVTETKSDYIQKSNDNHNATHKQRAQTKENGQENMSFHKTNGSKHEPNIIFTRKSQHETKIVIVV